MKARYDDTIDYRRRFCQASNLEGSLIKPILGATMDGTLTQSRQIAMTSARHVTSIPVMYVRGK